MTSSWRCWTLCASRYCGVNSSQLTVRSSRFGAVTSNCGLPPRTVNCELLTVNCRELRTANYRDRGARIFSLAPGAMRVLERRFQVLIFATVVSKSCAIEKSVSPRLTRYVTRTTSVGVVIAADSALDAMARDATAVGAARSVRAASSVAGARGMISSWPGRSRDRVVRLLASATSARETPNRRATVRSVSPLLAVYHFSAEESAGEAAARLRLKP